MVEVKILQNKKFGYVRVSSKDQNKERQIENMKYLGIEDRDIFIDKQSGKNMKRENYQMLKRLARTGDTIVFDSLTRLGRSMNDVLEEFRYFEQQRINLQFIKEPFINVNYNGETANDVIQQAVQKATLTILSAFAEKERNDIKQRQAEGIALAKKKGKHLGRPPVQITDQFIQAYRDWQSGKITAVGAMRKYDIKRSSFYKLVKEYEVQEETKHTVENK
ncbi:MULTISPECIES: recombinase family protein [Bacillus]|uniref:recombinase family protein n=1 Tax=Bacillus TaxID=1386 RepID=UPI000BF3A204|nr:MULTISPECIES: recombinase family protein [Bacillus cereus group]MDF9513157.1 recombinase family protein [Bacillus paranthracis]MDF9671655.1 recombinase family protein [Bacillus paranthracis]MDG1611945.1 recombinase family protein [Bacillus paranthracis]PEV09216.1 integrase [Bacillus cereus]PGM67019.1 integrase [Bacillus cereus]